MGSLAVLALAAALLNSGPATAADAPSVGECLNFADMESLDAPGTSVDCSAQHNAEVFAVAVAPDALGPPSQAFLPDQKRSELCTPPGRRPGPLGIRRVDNEASKVGLVATIAGNHRVGTVQFSSVVDIAITAESPPVSRRTGGTLRMLPRRGNPHQCRQQTGPVFSKRRRWRTGR